MAFTETHTPTYTKNDTTKSPSPKSVRVQGKYISTALLATTHKDVVGQLRRQTANGGGGRTRCSQAFVRLAFATAKVNVHDVLHRKHGNKQGL